MRAAVPSTFADPTLTALRTTSDFANVSWHGLTYVEHETVLAPNPDGTFLDRRYFRDARWMELPSLMVIWQVDANERMRGFPIIVSLGSDDRRRRSDDFFIRRMRAIQWVSDCAAPGD